MYDNIKLVLLNPVQRTYLACILVDLLIVAAIVSVQLVVFFLLAGAGAYAWTLSAHAAAVIPAVFVQLAIFYIADLFDFRRPFLGLKRPAVLLATVCLPNFLFYGAFHFWVAHLPLGAVLYGPLAAPFLYAWRRLCFGRPFLTWKKRRVAVLGLDDTTLRAIREMEKYPLDIFDIAAVFDHGDLSGHKTVNFKRRSLQVICDPARLRRAIFGEAPMDLLVYSARSGAPYSYGLDPFSGLPIPDDSASLANRLTNIILEAKLDGIKGYDAATFLKQLSLKVPVDLINANWFVLNFEIMVNKSKLKRFVKRAVDVVAAMVFIVLASPVMAMIALLVRLDSPGPVFFSQIRLGYRKRPFRLYKFRSMVESKAGKTEPAAQGEYSRVTRVGSFIRATHLDELPQLFNILKGEMSFIGPRPMNSAMEEDLQEQIPFYPLRYYVRPGLSGWAVVMYGGLRCPQAYKEYLEYDLFYIQQFSFLLDLIIFLKTVKVSFTRFGVKLSPESQLTAAGVAQKRRG